MCVCIICKNQFQPKNPKRPSKTCSKDCKNHLAHEITTKQFSDSEARDIHRQKSLEQKKSPEYIKRSEEGIKRRTARWKTTGYPRVGMQHSIESKNAIGRANTGRFKGKTWVEIYGPEVAEIRRKQNSLSMSKKNEVLLKDRRSSLETKLLPYLTDYENNIQVSYYTVDFINKSTNHIIEIYGDYWHCNPKIYKEDYIHPYLKISAQEKQKLDSERIKYLEQKGYSVTIVWESDLDEFINEYSLRNSILS